MNTPRTCQVLLLTVLLVVAGADLAWAAGQGGEYLSYQEPKPVETSWLSTIAYVVSLLVTFVVVIGLAYLTSRFVGQKMGRYGVSGEHKVVVSLPLGASRGVYVVEVAGRFLVLGVTDNNVNLLAEITDPAEVERLRTTVPGDRPRQFEDVFQRHLASLQQMSQKFPAVFGHYNRTEQEKDREKR